MALRLFKKKDGTPSNFSKVLKSAVKVAGVLPVPFLGKISAGLEKLGGKSGIDLSGAKPQDRETLGNYVNRVASGAGGAVAGFVETVDNNVRKDGSLSAVEQGFLAVKSRTWLLYAGVGLGLYFFLKKMRIF